MLCYLFIHGEVIIRSFALTGSLLVVGRNGCRVVSHHVRKTAMSVLHEPTVYHSAT